MTNLPNEADTIWLKEIQRRIDEGESIDNREMMVALRDKLPKGFKPADVDPRLVYVSGLSVEGLRRIGDSTRILPDLERIICYVRDRLLQYPNLEKVTAEEVAMTLEFPTKRAERLLMLLSSVPGSFISGAGGSGDGYGDIRLGRDDIVAEYLRFETLEELFQRAAQAWTTQMPVASPRLTPDARQASRETAFILMNMDPNDPTLTDVCNTIKRECSLFGVEASRIDDDEHSDRITDRILAALRESDFIIADLSGERPNVYYEVGYAHAIGKRPILYRKKGTKLHFDLSLHNVPEYSNNTDLSVMLRKRLEAVLGRVAQSSGGSKPA